MQAIALLRSLTPAQRTAFLAAYLGWTLDAFDYFVVVFVMKDIAHDFHATKTSVSFALLLTLACRPIGVLLMDYHEADTAVVVRNISPLLKMSAAAAHDLLGGG